MAAFPSRARLTASCPVPDLKPATVVNTLGLPAPVDQTATQAGDEVVGRW